jgi:hypothetical protein
MKCNSHHPKITLVVQEYITPLSGTLHNWYHIVIRFGNVFLCQVYNKKIITWPFSYQIPHQHLVLISALKPTCSLADISEPRADEGSDMKKGL